MNSATDSITAGSAGGTPKAARAATIFITASDDAEETQRANDTGASALLRKPFTNQVLLKSGRRALQGRPGAAM